MTDGDTAPARLPAGEPFYMPDGDRIGRITRAIELASRYNTLLLTDFPGARAILRELLGRIDDTAHVVPNVSVEYGSNIEIGANSLINRNCLLMDCYAISIGNQVQLAPNVQLITGTHDDSRRRSLVER